MERRESATFLKNGNPGNYVASIASELQLGLQEKGPECGSDGWTYTNVCQMREATSRNKALINSMEEDPAALEEQQHTLFQTGAGERQGVRTSCQCQEMILTSLSRLEANLCYTVSTWLQIQGLLVSDAGVYSCISHNAFGENVGISTDLSVDTGRGHAEGEQEHFDHLDEGSGDGQLAYGDYLGFF